MGFSYNVNVLNQKGSPAIYTDTFANRPSPGYAGRLFVSSDTSAIYEDTGTAWTLIANVSSGAGTLQQVTTNGNTSNVGIVISAGGLSTNSLTDTALTLGSVAFAGTGGLISQDNANLFWDDTNNRLGINTNTPGNSLDVHTSGTTPILALNNTVGSQSAISFLNTSSAKWRIGNTATDTFDIYNFTNATTAISIDSGSTVKFITSPKIKNGTGLSPEAGYGAIGFLTSGVIFQRDSSANKLFFDFSGFTAQRTFICPNADGTIALTSDLSSYLPLTGGTLTGSLTLTSPLTLTTSDARIKGGNTVGRLLISNSDTSAYVIIAGSSSTSSNELDLVTNSFIAFTTGSAYTESARISSLKNFLIGSTTDDTVNKLQVTGSAKFSSAEIGKTDGLCLKIQSATSTGNAFLRFYNSANTGRGYLGLFWNGVSDYMLYDSGGLEMTFNSSNKFSFIGGAGVLMSTLAGTGSRAVLADASGNLSAPVSDISVKENIEPLKYGLETIMKLNAVQFEFIERYKNYGEGLQIGAIAQEVEQIIPEAVFKTPSTGLKGIDYSQFNGIYIKAIQDQQKIIESLIQRIKALENK